jgi:hypothetical protein
MMQAERSNRPAGGWVDLKALSILPPFGIGRRQPIFTAVRVAVPRDRSNAATARQCQPIAS